MGACRAALLAKGFTPELPLPCGAKMFVRPDLFDVVTKAVRLQGIKLHSRHVLVSDDLVEIVISVVKNKMKLSKKIRRSSRAVAGSSAFLLVLPCSWSLKFPLLRSTYSYMY